jgi:hypothetical protein
MPSVVGKITRQYSHRPYVNSTGAAKPESIYALEINCALFLRHGQTKIAQDERKFLTPRKALE